MKLSHGYIEVITLLCVYCVLYNKSKKQQMKAWIREWDNQVVLKYATI